MGLIDDSKLVPIMAFSSPTDTPAELIFIAGNQMETTVLASLFRRSNEASSGDSATFTQGCIGKVFSAILGRSPYRAQTRGNYEENQDYYEDFIN